MKILIDNMNVEKYSNRKDIVIYKKDKRNILFRYSNFGGNASHRELKIGFLYLTWGLRGDWIKNGRTWQLSIMNKWIF